jgi:hypothetical protein
MASVRGIRNIYSIPYKTYNDINERKTSRHVRERFFLRFFMLYLQARCLSVWDWGLARTSLRRAPARALGLSVRPYSDLLRPARTVTIAHHEIRQ